MKLDLSRHPLGGFRVGNECLPHGKTEISPLRDLKIFSCVFQALPIKKYCV